MIILDSLGLNFNLLNKPEKEVKYYFEEHPSEFKKIIDLALKNEYPNSWRATWVLSKIIDKNDKRITPYLDKFIYCIPERPSGHQREILKILENFNFNEDIEGHVFDLCMNIWEDISKIPSVRIKAFSILFNIAKKYPELNNDIKYFTQSQYIETLSPGIKASIKKMIKTYKFD